MLYLILSPMRTAQDPGLEDKYVFIFNEFAAEYSYYSTLLLIFLIGGKFFISKYLRIFGHEK